MIKLPLIQADVFVNGLTANSSSGLTVPISGVEDVIYSAG